MGKLEARIRALILLRTEYRLKDQTEEETEDYLTDRLNNIAETLVDQLEEIWGL